MVMTEGHAWMHKQLSDVVELIYSGCQVLFEYERLGLKWESDSAVGAAYQIHCHQPSRTLLEPIKVP